jgi:hypothetical protein
VEGSIVLIYCTHYCGVDKNKNDLQSYIPCLPSCWY